MHRDFYIWKEIMWLFGYSKKTKIVLDMYIFLLMKRWIYRNAGWPNWLQSLQWFQWILSNNRPFTQAEKTAEGQDQLAALYVMALRATTHVNDRRALQHLPWDFSSLMIDLTFTIKYFWPKFMWLSMTSTMKGDGMSQFQNLAEDVDLQIDAPNNTLNPSCGGLQSRWRTLVHKHSTHSGILSWFLHSFIFSPF